MGFPEPLKMRPRQSSETGSLSEAPENSTWVALTSTPEVPSKTCDAWGACQRPRECQEVVAITRLDDGLASADLKDLTATLGAIWEGELDDCETGERAMQACVSGSLRSCLPRRQTRGGSRCYRPPARARARAQCSPPCRSGLHVRIYAHSRCTPGTLCGRQ
jgi:hypothetical protein